ncbi:MAG: DNA-deoxyinosine glycosylase [Sphaerochaetaceae bacterium]
MDKGFPPIENQDCKVLFLGTGPSVKSLEAQEYYAHKMNAFWPIMQQLFHVETNNYEEKKQLLLEHHIALWDTLKCFEREGSLDSSYKVVVPNDLKPFIIGHGSLRAVFFTGKKASVFYKRFVNYYPRGVVFCELPSPSSADTLPFLDKLGIYHQELQKFIEL